MDVFVGEGFVVVWECLLLVLVVYFVVFGEFVGLYVWSVWNCCFGDLVFW